MKHQVVLSTIAVVTTSTFSLFAITKIHKAYVICLYVRQMLGKCIISEVIQLCNKIFFSITGFKTVLRIMVGKCAKLYNSGRLLPCLGCNTHIKIVFS